MRVNVNNVSNVGKKDKQLPYVGYDNKLYRILSKFLFN